MSGDATPLLQLVDRALSDSGAATALSPRYPGWLARSAGESPFSRLTEVTFPSPLHDRGGGGLTAAPEDGAASRSLASDGRGGGAARTCPFHSIGAGKRSLLITGSTQRRAKGFRYTEQCRRSYSVTGFAYSAGGQGLKTAASTRWWASDNPTGPDQSSITTDQRKLSGTAPISV